MSHSGQCAVNRKAEKLEALSLATWPGKDVRILAGWTLRFADGFGHRPNSVSPLTFDGNDLETAVAEVEAAYRSRGLTPMFQISPAAKPHDLPHYLQQRGYRAEGHSMVYRADAASVRANCSPENVRLDADADFKRLVLSGSHSPADGQERLDILKRLTLPQIRATAMLDGIGRACGHGGAADGFVAINLVRTQAKFRRRGLARHVLGAIAQWAGEQNCEELYLCVEEDNAPARTLYERIGFQPVYGYYYLYKD